MKKILLLLFLLLTLTGCSIAGLGQPSPVTSGSAVEESIHEGIPMESFTPSDTISKESSAELEPPPVASTIEPEASVASPTAAPGASAATISAKLSTAEIVSAFEGYSDFERFWYKGGNAPAQTAEIISYNGMDYCRYETNEIRTFDEFTTQALSLMTKEQFDTLQARMEYIARDSALYGPVNYGRGDGSGFAGYECETVKLSDTEYELKAGHYFFATAFNADAAEEKKVLVGETICNYVLGDAGWRISGVEYASINSFAG